VTVEEPGLFANLVVPEELLTALSGRAWVAAMAEVEVAYLQVLADCGLAPPEAAHALFRWWQEFGPATLDRELDPARLGRLGAAAANPVVPLVTALRQAVPGAADWIHFGATSQDVLDSAAVLVARRAGLLVRQRLARLAEDLAELAREYRATPVVGRTLLQPALVSTLGWKAASWLDGVHQADRWLSEALGRLAIQLGGAVGTLASLGTDGPAVLAALASRLEVPSPIVPWHAARQRVAELAAALATVAGTAAKVALDLALLQQAEVQEIRDLPDGGGDLGIRRGGSSTMPHKRNPIDAVACRVAATRAAALVPVVLASLTGEHERALGSWQAEWAALAELLGLAGAAAEHAWAALERAEPRPEAMAERVAQYRAELSAEALTLALQPRLGRRRALAAIERILTASPPGGEISADALVQLARADPEVAVAVGREELKRLLDPRSYLGSAETWVERVLARQATWPWPADGSQDAAGDPPGHGTPARPAVSGQDSAGTSSPRSRHD